MSIMLKQLFDDLAYGEFANMAIGKAMAGGIKPDKYPKVVSFVNLGLLDLYTRFMLKKKECVVYQREGKTLYYLRPEHLGDVNAGDPEIYIDGTVEDPPAGDIIKLLAGFDEMGERIRLNDGRYPDDIFLPEVDVLKITPSDPPKVMSLVYQAAYPTIIIETGFDPETYALNFPAFLKTALLAHIASRLFVGKEAQAVEGEARISSTFLYRYEAECLKIENLSLVPAEEHPNDHFENNGWV